MIDLNYICGTMLIICVLTCLIGLYFGVFRNPRKKITIAGHNCVIQYGPGTKYYIKYHKEWIACHVWEEDAVEEAEKWFFEKYRGVENGCR